MRTWQLLLLSNDEGTCWIGKKKPRRFSCPGSCAGFWDAQCIITAKCSTLYQPRNLVQQFREHHVLLRRQREVDVDLIVCRRRRVVSVAAILANVYPKTFRMVHLLGVGMTSIYQTSTMKADPRPVIRP